MMTVVTAVLTAWVAGQAFGQGAGGQDRWDARLTDVKGTVTVFTAGADAEGMPGDKDMPLEPGDRIRTGEDSSAEVAFEGDSVVVLKANTQMTVTSTRKNGVELGLSLGSLLAKIHSSLGLGGFGVRTPTAVASVRGTEFAVEVAGEGESGETHVGVFDEGKVEVSGTAAGEAETLMTNQETVVRRGQRPLPPYVLKRLMKHRKLVRGFGKRAQLLKKQWAALPPEKRLEFRTKWMERARERMKKMREKAIRQKGKRGPAGPRLDREKMEKRRNNIRQGQR
ncbi:MAG: FecR domain-containing protein [Elusimicrobia bacterium]|nr:FecR domain-containing protein [Elusimicrobiota bacterium]